MAKTKEELKARMRELQGVMADTVNNAEKAEEFDKAERKFRQVSAELDAIEREEREKERRDKNQRDAGAILREVLAGQRTGKAEREITLGTQGEASGAISLRIEDLVPNLEEGNVLPSRLSIVYGVTGNVLYPTDASDMEMEEVAEVANLTDQDVDFNKVSVTPHRIGLSCDISNSAIDDLSFDILAHVRNKFGKALRKYLATKTYSQAKFTGNKGGFSSLAKSGDITLGAGTAYKSILSAIAAFTDKGFDSNSLCITIDAVTEANLKLEPKQKGVAGYVIEDGKLCGYPYTVSSKINTVLGGDPKTASSNSDTTKLYSTTARYLGIGYYDYLKVQQHGEIRLTFDATSKTVAKKNCTNITFNTEYSFTNLSGYIYDENGNDVNAFAIYEIK